MAYLSCVLYFTVPGVSEKKYGVADYQYFKNGNTQQCNIFRHNKYNFWLLVYEISTTYVKRNKIYELEKTEGSNGTKTIKGQIYAQACFIIQVPFNQPFLSRS